MSGINRDQIAAEDAKRRNARRVTGCVHQQDVNAVPGCMLASLECNLGWIFLIPTLIQRDVEAVAMRLQLLNSSRSEGVASSNHHLQCIPWSAGSCTPRQRVALAKRICISLGGDLGLSGVSSSVSSTHSDVFC